MGTVVKKTEIDQTIDDTAIRELKEESKITALKADLFKVAHLKYSFPHKPDYDQDMTVYILRKWQGNPTETDEMNPAWFPLTSLPLSKMWESDTHWLPLVLEGKKLTGKFTYAQNNKVLNRAINEVDSLI